MVEEIKKDSTVSVNLESALSQIEAKSSIASEKWKKRSIYKVPQSTKALNQKAYKPQVVSFGPYHHGAEQVKPMEEHKHRAFHNFIRNSGKPIMAYVEALFLVAEDLMEAYSYLESTGWSDKNKFLQLMILDGCFMLEILRANNAISAPQVMYGNYDVKDPIFSYHGKVYIVPHIQKDMLMLENQLPMLLLEKLIIVEGKVEEDSLPAYLNETILKFFSPSLYIEKMQDKPLHLLDLYRTSQLQGDPPKRIRPPNPVNEPVHIDLSALQLHDAGIQFKASNTHSFKDISFQGGVLAIPTLTVDDATESILLNLVALERSHVGMGNEVTSYVFFMDNIIDSAKDVSLLRQDGIIHIALGSEKDVANVFNHLAENVTPDPKGNLQDIHARINAYCNAKHHAWRAHLVHTYFRNPWAFLSLAAAIFLLVLTVVQSFYGIYPYYHPGKSN
ncbi:hypothetical protein Syun_015866 [Stephania yunnanensis]|uniref:Uncharacterized protein n=1 Tax=Stephania yunnanensis TaxID=152371 RepID=A0AAP0J435_9MAGN